MSHIPASANSEFARRPLQLADSSRAFFARLDRERGGRRLVVWGAGRGGAIAIELLRAAGRPTALVIDRDRQKQGSLLCGVPVAPVEALVSPAMGAGDYVLLASMHAPAMAAILQSQGWQPARDFRVFPAGSIYRPDFGFALEALPDAMPQSLESSETKPLADFEKPAVTVFASSGGNFYFRELRDFLVGGLCRSGWPAKAADETAERCDGVPLVVGPHEFFSIGSGVEWFSAESLRASVLVNTEQPQSQWSQLFEKALALGGAVLDLSPAVRARWLPLGWYPGCGVFDCVPLGLQPPAGWQVELASGALPGANADHWSKRPIDVLFIASHTPRREKWIASLQHALPNLAWRVHLPTDSRPLGLLAGAPVIGTAEFVALARRAKIVLNLHRDDSPYFEWQRIVWRGLWQRALVVTEPCGAMPVFDAGRDYVETPVEKMANTLEWLLGTEEGIREAETIRRTGWESGRKLEFHETAAALQQAVSKMWRTVGKQTVGKRGGIS